MYDSSFLNELFQEFKVVEFPALKDLSQLPGRDAGGFVYGLFWVANGSEAPFYVGQTHRLSERVGDYCTADFAASTDFRVGEAIRYLRDIKKYRIILKYKPSRSSIEEERTLLKKLHLRSIFLLNDLVGYDYRLAEKEEERQIIRLFCDVLLKIAE